MRQDLLEIPEVWSGDQELVLPVIASDAGQGPHFQKPWIRDREGRVGVPDLGISAL